MSTKAYDILARIESHTGSKIEPRRLRLHISCELQRQIDKHERLAANISAVLQGADTFDNVTHKAIRRAKQ